MNIELPSSEGAPFDQITSANAAADAKYLLYHSPIIPKLMACDAISRRLSLWARSLVDNEIHHGWEIQNPGLVNQQLEIAAKEEAIAGELSPVELQQAILETLLPVLDVFGQMQDLEVPADKLDDLEVDPGCE